MAYKVAAALVCAPDHAGKIRYHYRDSIIPWLDDERAAYLLRTGMVQQASDDDLPDDAPGERPKQSDPKADWVEYAVACGYDRDEAESLTKQDLVDQLS